MSANPQLSARYLADKAIRDPVYQFAEDAWEAVNAEQLDTVMVRYLTSFGIGHYAFYVGAGACINRSLGSGGTGHRALPFLLSPFAFPICLSPASRD